MLLCPRVTRKVWGVVVMLSLVLGAKRTDDQQLTFDSVLVAWCGCSQRCEVVTSNRVTYLHETYEVQSLSKSGTCGQGRGHT